MARTAQFSPAQFGGALNELIGLVTQGKSYVKIGRELGGALRDNPGIAQVSPQFWFASLTSMTYVAQLNAFKLFDSYPGTLTVGHVLTQAKGLKSSFKYADAAQVEAIIAVAQSQISGLLPASLAKIDFKRNNLLAHFNRRVITDPQKLANQLKVTFSDVSVVLQIAGSILAELSVRFRGVAPNYEMAGVDDYKGLLDLTAARLHQPEAGAI